MEELPVLKKRQMSGVFDWFRKPTRPTPPAFQVPSSIPTDVDIYAIFGLSPQASLAEIRRAYRDQARKFHPDLNPNDPIAARMFKQLTDYYGVLEDPERRAIYDRARAIVTPPVTPPPAPPPIPRYPIQIAPQPEEAPGYGRGPAPTPRAATPVPSGLPSQWETMFAPPEGEGAEVEAFFGHFPATPPRVGPPPQIYRTAPGPALVRPQAPYQPPIQAPVQVPLQASISEGELPSVQEIAQMVYYTWPLDEIWNVVRTERNSPAFRQSGIMQVDQLAGFVQGQLEYEVGEQLGIPPWFVQQYMSQGRAGFEELWNRVYAPMFQRITAAMDILKPQDIRGRFGLDADPRGTRVDLLYSERP